MEIMKIQTLDIGIDINDYKKGKAQLLNILCAKAERTQTYPQINCRHAIIKTESKQNKKSHNRVNIVFK